MLFYIVKTILQKLKAKSFSCHFPMVKLHENKEFPEEENKTVEFKAHDRLGLTQMTAREIEERLFQPSSRTLCAFLNMNKSSNLYLGVKDDGTVVGHHMYRAQMEHFQQSLDLLLGHKFTPPVDKYRYSVNFIEVESTDACSMLQSTPSLTIKQEHKLLERPGLCWCEQEIKSCKKDSKKPPLYVIHVRINTWDRKKDKQGFKVWPYFTTEEGKCYKRYNASNHELTQDRVIEETNIDVQWMQAMV